MFWIKFQRKLPPSLDLLLRKPSFFAAPIHLRACFRGFFCLVLVAGNLSSVAFSQDTSSLSSYNNASSIFSEITLSPQNDAYRATGFRLCPARFQPQSAATEEAGALVLEAFNNDSHEARLSQSYLDFWPSKELLSRLSYAGRPFLPLNSATIAQATSLDIPEGFTKDGYRQTALSLQGKAILLQDAGPLQPTCQAFLGKQSQQTQTLSQSLKRNTPGFTLKLHFYPQSLESTSTLLQKNLVQQTRNLNEYPKGFLQSRIKLQLQNGRPVLEFSLSDIHGDKAINMQINQQESGAASAISAKWNSLVLIYKQLPAGEGYAVLEQYLNGLYVGNLLFQHKDSGHGQALYTIVTQQLFNQSLWGDGFYGYLDEVMLFPFAQERAEAQALSLQLTKANPSFKSTWISRIFRSVQYSMPWQLSVSGKNLHAQNTLAGVCFSPSYFSEQSGIAAFEKEKKKQETKPGQQLASKQGSSSVYEKNAIQCSLSALGQPFKFRFRYGQPFTFTGKNDPAPAPAPYQASVASDETSKIPAPVFSSLEKPAFSQYYQVFLLTEDRLSPLRTLEDIQLITALDRPPLTPKISMLKQTEAGILLSFRKNLEEDVLGYTLRYRKEGDATFKKIQLPRQFLEKNEFYFSSNEFFYELSNLTKPAVYTLELRTYDRIEAGDVRESLGFDTATIFLNLHYYGIPP